ncbi:MAG: hypothetical protein Q9183_006220 [Haloplaca sp. 2 TL-2023]
MRTALPDRDIDFHSFQTQYVLFLFNDLADSPSLRRAVKLSRADAAVVVRNVRAFYLDPRAEPLELTAHIKRAGQRPVKMQIQWLRDAQSRWPEATDLPFFARASSPGGLLFSRTYWYGHDIDRALDPLVGAALDSFRAQLIGQGDPTDRPEKSIYHDGDDFMTLQIVGPREGDLVWISVYEFVTFLDSLRELFFAPHDWGAREFAADLISDHGPVAKVVLRREV